MKVLTLNWGGKKTGSISSIISSIEKDLCSQGFEFLHVYESGAVASDNYIRLSDYFVSHILYYYAHLTGRTYRTGRLPARKFIRILKKYNPDLVHIHCPNGFSIDLIYVLDYLKKKNIKTVITNHAEFFYTGSCPYAFECMQFVEGCIECDEYKQRCSSLFFDTSRDNWIKMYEAFADSINFTMVAVSPWQENRLLMSSITNKLDTRIILNGLNTDIFHRRKSSVCNEELFTVLHVTSRFSMDINDQKGGHFVLKLARRLEAMPIKIIVIGPYDNVDFSILPSNVEVLGPTSDAEALAEKYSGADITLSVSKRETFGMVCAESMCCGTPVTGFKNGGMETIALEGYAHLVDYGDVDALCEYIINYKRLDESERQLISKTAISKYSSEKMTEEYKRLYQSVICK